MRYVLIAAMAATAAVAGYCFGYVDAYRQWETLSFTMGRMTELDRASHLLRLAERVDTGDVPGARLRMVAVSSVGINSDAFGLSQSMRPSAKDVLLQRVGDYSLPAGLPALDAQNRTLESRLRNVLTALCSAPAAAGPEYNGACRR